MEFSDTQLKILVILSDEEGYSNNQLAKPVYGDKKYKGDISKALEPLLKPDGPVENLASKTRYREFNLHIKKNMDTFVSIISQIYEKYVCYHLEWVKFCEEYEMREKRGGWADDIMISFLNRNANLSKLDSYFKDALEKFTHSEYTGEMIKNYGIRDILNAIPMMQVKDFIRFVDWAEDKEFIDAETYVDIAFSKSQWMQKQFHNKSEKFVEYARIMASESRDEFKTD